jgi:hypothetical protein
MMYQQVACVRIPYTALILSNYMYCVRYSGCCLSYDSQNYFLVMIHDIAVWGFPCCAIISRGLTHAERMCCRRWEIFSNIFFSMQTNDFELTIYWKITQEMNSAYSNSIQILWALRTNDFEFVIYSKTRRQTNTSYNYERDEASIQIFSSLQTKRLELLIYTRKLHNK